MHITALMGCGKSSTNKAKSMLKGYALIAMQKGKEMDSLKAFYFTQIEEATTESQLDYLVEEAAFKLGNNADYGEVYTKAMDKYRRL